MSALGQRHHSRDLIGRTVAALRTISPTLYLNVPRDYALLLGASAASCESNLDNADSAR